jgi:F-type H+-transporting ATPase subunit b
MNIDWFTFVAQIVNFLLLVGLLRWFLYGPIVRAMQEREESIAGRMEEAQQKLDDAESKASKYSEKTKQFEHDREELLKDARHEAHEEHQRLLREAREDVERHREQWEQATQRDQDDFLADLRRQAGEMGLAAAKRTLTQLADAELEGRMCDKFTAQIEELGDDRREEIRQHLNNGEGEITLLTVFELSPRQQGQMRRVIGEIFGTELAPEFATTPDLICGMELNVGGYSFSWNAKDFLRDVESEFAERLHHEH